MRENYKEIREKIQKEMGERLAQLRKEAGMRQEDVAEHLGLHKAAVSNYEKGLRSPSDETVMKLADLFHVTTDYLFGRETREPEMIDVSELDDESVALLQGFVRRFRSRKES